MKPYEPPLLVGLVGISGSGKDKFYSTFLAKLGYTKLALADAVRVLSVYYVLKSYPGIENNEKELLRIFPLLYAEIFKMEKSAYSRTLQQYIGTDFGRKNDENIWIKAIEPLVNERLEKNIKVAITDIRFKNEANFVKSKGGILIKIENSGRYDKHQNEALHSSEKEINDIEYDFTHLEFEQKFSNHI